MFRGPPLPLLPDLSLSKLLDHASPDGVLGAWVRGCASRLSIYRVHSTAGRRLLACPDLGYLLTRCNRVVVREGDRPVALDAETVIQWRALQVATATPYLPGLESLRRLFPGLRLYSNDLVVPLHGRSAEEILACCMAEGVQVTGSRVVYGGPSCGSG